MDVVLYDVQYVVIVRYGVYMSWVLWWCSVWQWVGLVLLFCLLLLLVLVVVLILVLDDLVVDIVNVLFVSICVMLCEQVLQLQVCKGV